MRIQTEANGLMNTNCCWPDRRIPAGHQSDMQAAPSSHQSWTCRQTLTITVGQQLHQAVEAGVSDSAYVSCAAPNGLDGGCHKVLVHAANVGLREATTE